MKSISIRWSKCSLALRPAFCLGIRQCGMSRHGDWWSPRKLTFPRPSSMFYAATGDERPDPTGLIACPQPCNVPYAAAYSLFQKPVTRYAASWEASESNFDYLLTYVSNWVYSYASASIGSFCAAFSAG